MNPNTNVHLTAKGSAYMGVGKGQTNAIADSACLPSVEARYRAFRDGLNSTLNAEEAAELSTCELVIQNGWKTFIEVGKALSTIRDKRLYRDGHKTFEDYCRERWEFSKSHANRLIGAASVVGVLTPIGVKCERESLVRPLVGLTPGDIRQVWKRIEESAVTGKITGRDVRRAVTEFYGMGEPLASRERPKSPADLRKVPKPAFSLIDQVAEAAQKHDVDCVLRLLEKLRRLLQEPG